VIAITAEIVTSCAVHRTCPISALPAKNVQCTGFWNPDEQVSGSLRYRPVY
jgi:hypothetical protein